MVRVIAGEFRSRRLKTLKGLITRPTSDRIKETLFNLLQSQIEGSVFLDGFAGSGSIGLEALSRGASSVIFVESSLTAVRIIQENLELLGLGSSQRCRVYPQTLERVLRIMHGESKNFDIVFLDPPYAAVEESLGVLVDLQTLRLLNHRAIVVLEHSKFTAVSAQALSLEKYREIRQGNTVLSLFQLMG